MKSMFMRCRAISTVCLGNVPKIRVTIVMWGTSYRRGPRGQEQPTAASGKAQAGQES